MRTKKGYSADYWTAEDYVNEYLPEVKKRSRLWNCKLRVADQALWGLSVSRRVEKIIAKSEQA